VAELLDTKPEVAESAGKRLPESFSSSPVRKKLRESFAGEIVFDAVTLSHDRGPVLENVSFRAAPGRTLAIVGASGSGKSTITDLVVRLLDPDAGTVRLDGRDLRDLRLVELRRTVHVVGQEPTLFHTSIDENVRYARPDASDADVAAAVEAAGVSTFLPRLPNGRQTVVGDRGLTLSAGERQRIALARAFLANPVVLVRDEPSAALDPVAERHLVDGYRRVMRDRTVILITHRLELVRAADDVVVLEGAAIVERGTPRELEARGGAFARLFGAAAPAVTP
jgi:ATP-binding cassette subfamily B protein